MDSSTASKGHGMNVFEQMEIYKDALTPRERAVYDIVSANPDAVLGSTSVELAQRFGVSQSAISRFCQKVGYEGYGEFRMQLHKSLAAQSFDDASAPSHEDCLVRLLSATSETLAQPEAQRLASAIRSARYVYTLGSGQSSTPARMLASRLREDAICANYVESGDAQESLHVMDQRDLVVMFSSKNATFAEFMSMRGSISADHRPRVALVTHTARHPHAKESDPVVVLPTWSTLSLPLYLEPQDSMVFFCMMLSRAQEDEA